MRISGSSTTLFTFSPITNRLNTSPHKRNIGCANYKPYKKLYKHKDYKPIQFRVNTLQYDLILLLEKDL